MPSDEPARPAESFAAPYKRPPAPHLSLEEAAAMFARRRELTFAERSFYLEATPVAELPPETTRLVLLGRMDQRCPDCEQHEAAHYYCSRCLLPMAPDDWYDRKSKPPKPMSQRYADLLSGKKTRPSRAVEAELVGER